MFDLGFGFRNVLDLCYILPILWICVLLGSYIIQYTFAWIDDNNKVGNNAVNKFVMTRIFGFEWRKNGSGYDKQFKYSDGSFGILSMLSIFAILPVIFFTVVNFTTFSLTILVIIGGLYLTRFVRRLSKKLNVHMLDKNMHHENNDN